VSDTPTVAELEEKYPNHKFRYPSEHAKSKHAIRMRLGQPDPPIGAFQSAMCGRSPVWFDPVGWKGTGTQEEYEKNDALPACKRCLFMLNRGSMTHQVKPSK